MIAFIRENTLRASLAKEIDEAIRQVKLVRPDPIWKETVIQSAISNLVRRILATHQGM